MNFIKSNNAELWAQVFGFAKKKNEDVSSFDFVSSMIHEGANTENPIVAILGIFFTESNAFLAVSFLLDPEIDECSNIQAEICRSIDDFSIVTFEEKAHIKSIIEV